MVTNKNGKGAMFMRSNVGMVSSSLAILLLGGGLVACTTQAAGGTGGSGGTSSTGTGGITGTGTGGSGGPATGDYAGITCLPPTQSITDFTYVPGDAATPDTTQVRFGTFGTTFSGGEDAYGSLTSDVTAGDWHISGTVADYSGWGLYFDVVNSCDKLDASQFSGVTFTIWGSAGMTGTVNNMVTMGMATLEDSVAYSWLDTHGDDAASTTTPGTCTPTSGNSQYYHPGCADPTYSFAVTGTQAAPQTVTVKWSDFAGGSPTASVTPTGILSWYWNVPWSTTATSYAVDLHIDNLAFTP